MGIAIHGAGAGRGDHLSAFSRTLGAVLLDEGLNGKSEGASSCFSRRYMSGCLSEGSRQTARDRSRVKRRAETEIMVSHTDHVLRVCVTLILKYSFTSQNPPSFTCEKIREPAPVAIAR